MICSSKLCFLVELREQLADQHLVKRGPRGEKMEFSGIPSEYSDFVFNQKRVPGMEFVGKRSEGMMQSYNIPVVGNRGWMGMELMGKRAPGMEFVGKRAPGMGFVGKRAPGMEFVGKRSPGIPFVVKRAYKNKNQI